MTPPSKRPDYHRNARNRLKMNNELIFECSLSVPGKAVHGSHETHGDHRGGRDPSVGMTRFRAPFFCFEFRSVSMGVTSNRALIDSTYV